MKKRTISILIIVAMILNFAAVDFSFAAKRGWVRNAQGEKTSYVLSNGKRAAGFWIIADRGYVFSPQGKMITGKVISKDRPYYIKNSNGMSDTKRWITFKNGKKSYNAGYGKLLTGVHKIKGHTYGFDKKGYMLKGRHRIDNQPYFFGPNGMAADRGWIRSINTEVKLYYCTGNGKLLSGLQNIGDRAYYFDKYGKMRTGKWYIDDDPYYFKDRKGMGPEKGWLTLENGKKVYNNGYGKLLTGVNTIDGEVYGFGDDGYILSGKHVLKDGLYYFDKNGKAYPKGWINDKEGNPLYYSLGDGRIATKRCRIGGKTYHFDKEGNPRGYHINKEGKNYFLHVDGTPYPKGWIRNDDERGYMYCSGEGCLLTGYHIISKEAYFFDEKGELDFGKITVDGRPYYFSESKRGEGSKPRWIHFKSGLSAYTKGYGELATGEYVIDHKKYTFDKKGYIRLQRKGIDVSVFQGRINWKEVRNDGVEFAFIRTGGRFGESGKIYSDDEYEYNMKNAIANGIDVGVYFFTQAVNTKEAVEEAKYTCKKLKNYDVKMPVVIDTEYLADCRHNDISRKQRTAVVKAFCEEVKRQGYEPMIYANLNWLNKHLNMKELKDYRVWVAQYYDECQYKGDYNCWQYTSSGRVKGIDGRVDMNIWYQWDPVE